MGLARIRWLGGWERPGRALRLDDFRRERVRVSVFSTLRVANNVYSVVSRLIGEWVDIRLYAERIEVHFAGERVAEMERLRGRGHAAIDCRHLIWSLIRKPGAFELSRATGTGRRCFRV